MQKAALSTRWTGSEPVVVGLGAGDAHPLGRNVVQLDRFLLLGVVPYQHSIGNLVNQPLRRQMIPAADAEYALDARAVGRSARGLPGANGSTAAA